MPDYWIGFGFVWFPSNINWGTESLLELGFELNYETSFSKSTIFQSRQKLTQIEESLHELCIAQISASHFQSQRGW